MTLEDIAKYFANGILFAVFFLYWPIGWYPAILLGLLFDSILLWAIGAAVIALILGFFNSLITSYLWGRVELPLRSILLQGFILLAVLLILGGIFASWDIWIRWIPGILILFPSWRSLEMAMTAAKLFPGSFLIGFVGRKTVEWPKEKETKRAN